MEISGLWHPIVNQYAGTMKTILLITSLLMLTLPSNSQKINWNTTPKTGYVYEITNREARKLLVSHNSKGLSTDLLHTLTDSFDVNTGWINRPEKGHFILVTVKGNKLHCEYTCVMPYQVFLFKEYNTLALQVVDLHGNVRKDARVSLPLQIFRADPESKTYRIQNTWIAGNNRTMSVELMGFRSFYKIDKHDPPVWLNHPDDWNNGPSFYSYLITDKNKYKPGDKVRYKSYALAGNRTPLRKDLDIWIVRYPKQIKIGKVTPYHPGGYTGEFYLNDSLKLTLDQNYTLELRDHWQTVASCFFRYEEYELSGNKLDVKLEKKFQYSPDTNRFTILATDANGLQLKNAQATILVKTGTILESFQPVSVMKDTLLYKKMSLTENDPVVIAVPPSLFAKTNTTYEVSVIVTDADNRKMDYSESCTFIYNNNNINCRLSADSICFDYMHNNVPIENVPMSLQKNNEPFWKQVTLPYKEKLNTSVTNYRFQNKDMSRDFSLTSMNPKLEIDGGILRDSFSIKLLNPHMLDVSWYVYQGSELIAKGSGREIDYGTLIADRTMTWYVELLYSFGGRDYVKRSQYEFRDAELNVDLRIPDRVFPGQQTDVAIAITDQLGKPVRNVDLTALAVSSKLNYYVPDLPYYGNNSNPRPRGTTYNKKDLNRYSADFELDYCKWIAEKDLDTMMYYRFSYPDSLFIFETGPVDGTQFAPFVMQNGEATGIDVIEVDHMPVYFSWSAQPKAYSFLVKPGVPHSLSLRLPNQIIILDSVVFEKNQKTLLSINPDCLPAMARKITMEKDLSQSEQYRYIPYTAAFKVTAGNFGYLESAGAFVPLFEKTTINYGFRVAGPVSPAIQTYYQGDYYKISYLHEGNYNYDFSGNVVYKLTAGQMVPHSLKMKKYNPMDVINDVAITRTAFLARQITEKKPERWFSTTIDVKDPNTRIRINLPSDTENIGLAAVVFRDCNTGQTTSPSFTRNYIQSYRNFTLPNTYQSVFVVYTNGEYYKADSIVLKKHSQVLINFKENRLHPADSTSQAWAFRYGRFEDYHIQESAKPVKRQTIYQMRQNVTGDVTGVVKDENDEPLPGVNILIKGTTYGTITDLDGRFSLDLDDYSATLNIMYLGYIPEELDVTKGSEINILLQPDIQALDEVVVVGYGLQGKANGLCMSRAITTISSENEVVEDDTLQTEKQIKTAEENLYNELMKLNTIRSNFTDVGFWQPALYTDKKGEARFRVTFPDDITRWDATVLAMNRYLQTGTAHKIIRSYKPIMAQLNVPPFLTEGDSAILTAQVVNYSHDKLIEGKSEWTLDGITLTNAIRFESFHSDMLPVNILKSDSINIQYTFTRDDGYLDGESRFVPVFNRGITRADGTLELLKNGDKRNVIAGDSESITVSLITSPVDIYRHEISYLFNYRYACNEQLASRLVGLLNYKLLARYEQKSFNHEKEIHKIINRLLRNLNTEFLWSWWDKSDNSSYWVSAHVLRALKYAQNAGYTVDLDIENVTRKAAYKYEFLNNFSIYDVDLVHALSVWDAEINYGRYLSVLDTLISGYENRAMDFHGNKLAYSGLKEKFQLLEIRKMQNLPFERDSLLKYKKEGVLAEVYFADDKAYHDWYSNEMEANIIAYRICRNDSLLRHLTLPMQMYFLKKRENTCWNTYESANVLMTVFPDILSGGITRKNPSSLLLTGRDTVRVDSFPYNLQLAPEENLQIEKISGLPVYLMKYKEEVVTEARTGVEGFEIRTWFNRDMPLKAGEPVDLIVEVKVKKEVAVENVMIEIPIPAGFSYVDKRQGGLYSETHREYFKNKTSIFCDKLYPGYHLYSLKLLPRFSGTFSVNPAQVSLMYIPVVNANNSLKTLKVGSPANVRIPNE